MKKNFLVVALLSSPLRAMAIPPLPEPPAAEVTLTFPESTPTQEQPSLTQKVEPSKSALTHEETSSPIHSSENSSTEEAPLSRTILERLDTIDQRLDHIQQNLDDTVAYKKATIVSPTPQPEEISSTQLQGPTEQENPITDKSTEELENEGIVEGTDFELPDQATDIDFTDTL
jgi:hypothetical protein